MQAHPHHAGLGSILKLLLGLGLIAVLVSVFGPLLRESPSSRSYEWGNQLQRPAPLTPDGAPSGEPAGQEVATESSGEGPLFESASRPSGIPQTTGPVEAGSGTSSPWGITGDDAYDCSVVVGAQLAAVSLASIKTFMDRAYQNFLQAEQMGDSATAEQERQSYANAQTDLEKKKWRCFHCVNEIGCSEL